MQKTTLLKIFAQECSILVDQGHKVSVQVIKDKIESGDMVEWIKSDYMNEEGMFIGINSFSDQDKKFIQESYHQKLMGYYDDVFRKWGIENNGLNLLVSWGIELLNEVNPKDAKV